MDPVVSVPHSGTRSLVRSLGTTQFYHFGQNEKDIEKLSHFHFPMRDPLAVSLSWRSYYPDRDRGVHPEDALRWNEKQTFDEFRRWSLAIAWMKDHDHTVHMMNEYPNLEGRTSESFWWKKAYKCWDIDALLVLPEVEYLLEWITIPSVQSFFLQYYPEGFWWAEMARQPNLKRSANKDTSAAGLQPTYRDGRLIA